MSANPINTAIIVNAGTQPNAPLNAPLPAPLRLPRTRCLQHVIDLVSKGQAWQFARQNLDAGKLAQVMGLWEQVRDSVNSGAAQDVILSALQAVLIFIELHAPLPEDDGMPPLEPLVD